MTDTPTMWACPDGGTCHHDCKRACFRVLTCAPLSMAVKEAPADYPEGYWHPEVQRMHREADGGGAVQLGYAHAGLVGTLRPDVAHPGRKIRAGKSVVTTITADPCDCSDGHVVVFVAPVQP